MSLFSFFRSANANKPKTPADSKTSPEQPSRKTRQDLDMREKKLKYREKKLRAREAEIEMLRKKLKAAKKASGAASTNGPSLLQSNTWTGKIKADGIKVVLYVSGPEGVGYQANMWIPVLEKLSVRCAIVIRKEHIAQELIPTKLPVYFLNTFRDLESIVEAGVKTVLYAGNAQKNIEPMRFYRLNHFFVNHGESDKVVNQSKFLMAYDKLLVAGPLAERRLRAAKLPLRPDQIVHVGRPQVALKLSRIESSGPLRTILYAPTWEGFVDAADYSSVGEFGLALLTHLLESRRFKVLFKPHPFTGNVSESHKEALGKMRNLAPHEMLEVIPPGEDIHTHMNRSDLMITDVSSVLNDYLYTRKPMILTNPMRFSQLRIKRDLPSSAATYVLNEPSTILSLLESIQQKDTLWQQREAVCVDSLGHFPEGSFTRFDRIIRDSALQLNVIAHRGGAGQVTENTLAAFENCIEIGCRSAELDVQLTKDGEVVVHHDAKLDWRHTKKGGRWITKEEEVAIADLTWQELQAYEIGEPNPESNYLRKYPHLKSVAGQRVPLLREVAELVSTTSDDFSLIVEFKTPVLAALDRPWEPLVDATIRILHETGQLNSSAFCSFDWGALIYAKRMEPSIRTWFLTLPESWLRGGEVDSTDGARATAYIEELRRRIRSREAHWYGGFDPRKFDGNIARAITRAGGDGWFCYHRDWNQSTIAQANECKLTSAAWHDSLCDEAETERLRLLGVEWFCSDYLEKCERKASPSPV